MNAPIDINTRKVVQDNSGSRLKAFTSALLSRIGIGNLTGVAFGGARDYYSILGYNRSPQHHDFLGKYLRQDITQRIINAPVNATWSDPPQLIGSSSFDSAWKELVEKNDIYAYLGKVDIFAGLGQYAVLLIGFDDGRNLNQPVNPNRANKILYLQPYLEGSVVIKEFEENTASVRFGQPTMYEITPGDINQINKNIVTKAITRNKLTVHWSRVLHVADGTLENTVYGHSRLEPIYNSLDDLIKVVGGSAETYWMAGNRGIQVDIDKDMELNEEDAESITEEIEEYQHGQRRFIRTRGVKVENLGSDVADPRSTFDTILSIIAAATGIPKRVLIGVEAGQLASQQDRANWAVVVNERIANFAQPRILKPFIRLLQAANVLPIEDSIEYNWPDAYKMSPLERSQTSAQMARSMTNATKAMAQARNECEIDIWSVEEVRRIVTFDKHMPVLSGLPEGTLPPPKPEPIPQENQPFGGNPGGNFGR